MPNSPVHFEIPADDVARAKKFYEKALGWKIADPFNMNYFFVTTKEKGEEGINGGLMQRMNPGQPFMVYVAVASIDAALKKVERAGGRVALPKTAIGNNMGFIGAFQDTEGNLMGFHQMPPPPKPAKKAIKKAVRKAAKKAVKKR